MGEEREEIMRGVGQREESDEATDKQRIGIKVLIEGKGMERVGQLRQSCRTYLKNFQETYS